MKGMIRNGDALALQFEISFSEIKRADNFNMLSVGSTMATADIFL